MRRVSQPGAWFNRGPARWSAVFASGLCADCVRLRSHRRWHRHSDRQCSLEWRPQPWRFAPHKKRQTQERPHLPMTISNILVFQVKTFRPSIKKVSGLTQRTTVVERERIRFGEVGAGNNLCFRSGEMANNRNQPKKTNGKTPGIRYATPRRPHG